MLSQSKAGEAEGGIMAERRRNMRAEACRSCGAACAAGAGYLYRDLGTGRRRVQAARLRSYFVAPDYTPPALGQAHPHYQHSEG
jgi:hypothetical protein